MITININRSISSPPFTSQFSPTTSSSWSLMRCSQPTLINLNDDEDLSPSTPPRPSSPLYHSSPPHQIPKRLSVLDTTLNGEITILLVPILVTPCSINQSLNQGSPGNVENDDTMVNSSLPPNISNFNHNPNHQSNSEPSVILNYCTDGNGDELPSSNNTSNHEHVNEKESEFVREWHNRITSATTFVEFSRSCDLLASDVVTKGKEMSTNNPTVVDLSLTPETDLMVEFLLVTVIVCSSI